MALALYLIGAPGAGKSTVFDALTSTPQGPHFSSQDRHRLGTVKVPDPRLEALEELYRPKKCTPAEVTFVDVGLPPASGEPRRLGELTAFLSEADAFSLVVQAFGEMDYRGREPDPVAQLEAMLLELIVADLEKVERRLQRLAEERQKGQKGLETEEALLERCRAWLEAERPLRRLALKPEEDKRLRGFRFLSQKPLLVVANVAETRLDGSGLEPLRAACAEADLELIAFCAPLEAEIAQLDAEAQTAFLQDYGLERPARERLIRAAYRLLGLISFFTVGEDEVRAWTVPYGTAAQEAAGKIHSDMERGFIRAETVGWQELVAAGSWAACREQGLLRLEGKTYLVQDGDVIHVRFNA